MALAPCDSPPAGADRTGAARRLPLATYLAGGLPLLAGVYGATAGRRRTRVVTVEVPLTGLPPNLDGLRLVHLSDLHIGDFMPRAAIRRAVDLANTVKPDLAVLTGDVITSARDPLEDCAYGPIAQHFRPRRHRWSASAYRQEMRHRFDTWQDLTNLPTAA